MNKISQSNRKESLQLALERAWHQVHDDAGIGGNQGLVYRHGYAVVRDIP
jgi:hypothetical protein